MAIDQTTLPDPTTKPTNYETELQAFYQTFRKTGNTNEKPEFLKNKKSVFLAGSIEMGAARMWQPEMGRYLFEKLAATPESLVVFNPRRDDWNPKWDQNKANEMFRGQVEWELNALQAADVIALYFESGTRSPISLLELGLFGGKKQKVIVGMGKTYERKGNVDIVCEREGIEVIICEDAKDPNPKVPKNTLLNKDGMNEFYDRIVKELKKPSK